MQITWLVLLEMILDISSAIVRKSKPLCLREASLVLEAFFVAPQGDPLGQKSGILEGRENLQ